MPKRTRPCVISAAEGNLLFELYVPLASCKEKKLWRLKHITKSGFTSDWQTVASAYSFLAALLACTKGLIPRQVSLEAAFAKFLDGQKLEWGAKEQERVPYHVRVMLRSLLRCKRPGASSPQKEKCSR